MELYLLISLPEGDCPGLIGWANVITRVFKWGKGFGRVRTKDGIIRKT